jgi:hypothetical protein
MKYHHHHHHQWLYSICKDSWPVHHRGFRNLIKILGRAPLEEWSARRKGLYLHRTTQHRNTKTNIHASTGIRTHDPRNQAAKTYSLDRATTGTSRTWNIKRQIYAVGYQQNWKYVNAISHGKWFSDTKRIKYIKHIRFLGLTVAQPVKKFLAFRKTRITYRIQKSLPLTFLSQMNPIRTPTDHFLKKRFNIVF